MAGGPYLKGLSTIRNVQWGAKYLWDIRFPDAPPPFNNWFPAVDIDMGLFELNFKAFELGIGEFGVPIGTSSLDLSLTFNDDVSDTIQNWLTRWVRIEILNQGAGLSPLSRCVKLVQIARLDFQRRPITVQTFWVVPTGSMKWNGTSSADVNQNTCDFKIVGVADSIVGSDASPGIFKKFKIGAGGGLGGLIKSAGNLFGVDLSSVASTVDGAIDIARQGYDTYKQVKETYEDVKTIVDNTVRDVRTAVNAFKDARSLDDYLNAADNAVNVYNNTLSNADSVVDRVSSGYNGAANTVTQLENKLKNIF